MALNQCILRRWSIEPNGIPFPAAGLFALFRFSRLRREHYHRAREDQFHLCILAARLSLCSHEQLAGHIRYRFLTFQHANVDKSPSPARMPPIIPWRHEPHADTLIRTSLSPALRSLHHFLTSTNIPPHIHHYIRLPAPTLVVSAGSYRGGLVNGDARVARFRCAHTGWLVAAASQSQTRMAKPIHQ